MAYAAINLPVGEPTQSVEPVKQRISEVSLTLKNLSYAISGMVGGEEPLDPDNMTQAMFALHRQVTALSSDLDDLMRACEACTPLQSPVELFPTAARCPTCGTEKEEARASGPVSPISA